MKRKKITDKDRLDWLERTQNGLALIHDDHRHWAVSFAGLQPVISGRKPVTFSANYHVTASDCRRTVRAAIDAAIRDEEQAK